MIQILRRQFTVRDFAKMGEAGILTEDDRVELIDGEVRIMSPIGARHAAIVKRLNAILTQRLECRAIVGVQDPIELTDYTEPQPDLTVLRFRNDFYEEGHPTAADTLLVIEVADTSLEYDREEKIPRYAQVGISEVWLIDIERNVVTQFTQPGNSGYELARILQGSDQLSSVSLPGVELSVSEIFGQQAGR